MSQSIDPSGTRPPDSPPRRSFPNIHTLPAKLDTQPRASGAHEGIERLLARIDGPEATLRSVEPLNGDRKSGELKQVGYGAPLLVQYEVRGKPRRLVFRTQAANWFGHDRRSDRACLALLAADTFADQPHHSRVLDVGAIRGEELVSIRGAGEFYLVTSYEEGTMYASHLHDVEERGFAEPEDLERAQTLAQHLVEVHKLKPAGVRPEEREQVYRRALRDLVGSGEGIFGIADSYPNFFARTDLVRSIEQLATSWRWRLGRCGAARLCRTHGDFHPYNILFGNGMELAVLDASRGGAGDPADDLAALSINYLFAGMRRPHTWQRGFRPLWSSFFQTYLSQTHDTAVFDCFAPFFAWRALVLASPAWYPDVSEEVRVGLLTAAVDLLEGTTLRPDRIEDLVPLLPKPTQPDSSV